MSEKLIDPDNANWHPEAPGNNPSTTEIETSVIERQNEVIKNVDLLVEQFECSATQKHVLRATLKEYKVLIPGSAISEDFIKQIHKIISEGNTKSPLEQIDHEKKGEYRKLDVFVRSNFIKPAEIETKMSEFINFVNKNTDSDIDPIEKASQSFIKFINIHPFIDGNGRISRFLLNLQLLRNGCRPIDIKLIDWKYLGMISVSEGDQELIENLIVLALDGKSLKNIGLTTIDLPRRTAEGKRLPKLSYSHNTYSIQFFGLPQNLGLCIINFDTKYGANCNKCVKLIEYLDKLISEGNSPDLIYEKLYSIANDSERQKGFWAEKNIEQPFFD